jgi:hypothetical protein
MTRTKTAGRTGLTPYEAKRLAIERVVASRVPPKYLEFDDGRGGKVRFQADAGQEFSEPQTLDAWLDQRVARMPLGLLGDMLIGLFETLRSGTGAVAAAVALAGPLTHREQFATYMTVAQAPGGPADAEVVRSAFLKAWRRAGLPDTPEPRAVFGSDPMDRNTARPAQIEYRTPRGHNAA